MTENVETVMAEEKPVLTFEDQNYVVGSFQMLLSTLLVSFKTWILN